MVDTRIQYRHLLTVTTGGDSVQDVDGHWVTVDGASGVPLPCRAEPSGGNGMINTTDGKLVNFDWIIYLPVDSPTIPEGSQVTIINELAEHVATDRVKRFSRGYFNVRLWL